MWWALAKSDRGGRWAVRPEEITLHHAFSWYFQFPTNAILLSGKKWFTICLDFELHRGHDQLACGSSKTKSDGCPTDSDKLHQHQAFTKLFFGNGAAISQTRLHVYFESAKPSILGMCRLRWIPESSHNAKGTHRPSCGGIGRTERRPSNHHCGRKQRGRYPELWCCPQMQCAQNCQLNLNLKIWNSWL